MYVYSVRALVRTRVTHDRTSPRANRRIININSDAESARSSPAHIGRVSSVGRCRRRVRHRSATSCNANSVNLTYAYRKLINNQSHHLMTMGTAMMMMTTANEDDANTYDN